MEELNYLTIVYPDFVTEGDKKIRCKNIGEKYASINSFFLDYLKEFHIPVAFIKAEDKNTLRFIKYNKVDFAIKVLNIVDKRTAKIFGKAEGDLLPLPIMEYHFSGQKDSLINESHIFCFELCNTEDLKIMNRLCSKINAVLKSYFERRSLILAEFICYFGKNEEKIILVDDFTPKSLKIIQPEAGYNPYKLKTASDIKNYTDQIYNIMSN